MPLDLNLVFVILMFATFIGLLATGYPVAFVLAGTGLIFALVGDGLNYWGFDVDADLSYLGLVVNRIFGIMSSYALVPIPLFIFMGHMLDRSGVADRLLRAAQALFGGVPGGLAISVTLIGVVLAASTGIIGASVVLLGTLALPTMLRDNTRVELAVGTVCASGSLGILIPPSIMLVLMADQMLLTVGDLFMGAVFPGLVLALLYVLYIGGVAFLKPEAAPPMADSSCQGPGAANLLLTTLTSLIPPLGLILAVLGSIFFGIASPTEAAGLGAMGATLLAAASRRLSPRVMREVCHATAKTTSFIFAIFLGAACFSVVLRGVGGDEVIAALLTGLPLDSAAILAVMLGLVFVLGFVLDWIEITLIVLPLLQPVVPLLGVDPLWFTIMVAVCLQTSFLTPPVGFALFYLKGVAPPEVRIGHLYRGVAPFVLLQLLGLAIIAAFPALVTWLPAIAYGD